MILEFRNELIWVGSECNSLNSSSKNLYEVKLFDCDNVRMKHSKPRTAQMQYTLFTLTSAGVLGLFKQFYDLSIQWPYNEDDWWINWVIVLYQLPAIQCINTLTFLHHGTFFFLLFFPSSPSFSLKLIHHPPPPPKNPHITDRTDQPSILTINALEWMNWPRRRNNSNVFFV